MGWEWLSVGNPKTLAQGQNWSLGLTLSPLWVLRMPRRKPRQQLRIVFTEAWFQRPTQKDRREGVVGRESALPYGRAMRCCGLEELESQM